MKDKHDQVTPDFPDMEGDFIYEPSQREVVYQLDEEYVKQAFEESYFHQCLVDFERLFHRHGLQYLLEHMGEKFVDDFLTAAHQEYHDRLSD